VFGVFGFGFLSIHCRAVVEPAMFRKSSLNNCQVFFVVVFITSTTTLNNYEDFVTAIVTSPLWHATS